MHDQGLLGLQPGQGCPHSGQGKSLLSLFAVFSYLPLPLQLLVVCIPSLFMTVAVGAAALICATIIQSIDTSRLVTG